MAAQDACRGQHFLVHVALCVPNMSISISMWVRLVADNCTVLTFDLVDCGIVFFDKTKFKQNFNVNY